MSTSSANKREAIRLRDGDRCWLCGRPMKFDNPRRLTGATLDHVLPRSRGGSNDLANLKLAHRVCNERRADASEIHP